MCGIAHQLLRNASSMPGLSILPTGHTGTPCASMLRQQVHGVIHKSPGRPSLEATLHAGERPSCVGSEQGDASSPPKDNSHCPIFFTRSTDALDHEWPSLPLYAFPPIALLPQVLRRVRERWHKLLLIAPLWRNQPWVSELFQLLTAAPWPIPLRQDLISQAERHDMASTARVMGPACVAAQRETCSLLECVLNTVAEPRAPSTRHLYALKWSIFSTWCQDRDLEPDTSKVSVVLSFLQEMMQKQCSSSTIKVYVAAIAAFLAPIAGRSVGRDSVVIQFLQGTRRINPSHPHTVSPWDLPTILRALKGPPVEPLQSSSLRVLSLKTALLLALASVKQVGDLQALSVNPACLEFGPNDSKVVSYRKSEQLFVGFGNHAKGSPVTKQIISR